MTDSPTLHGRRCLITGANSGIGWFTAQQLAEWGAEVWMLCRSPERGEDAYKELAERCRAWGTPSPRLFLADLSDLEQVKQVALQIIEAGKDPSSDQGSSTLDILINNAGLIVPRLHWHCSHLGKAEMIRSYEKIGDCIMNM